MEAQRLLEDLQGPPAFETSDRGRTSAWTQLLLDEKRLMAAVHGPPGSDGRVSLWHRHPLPKGAKQPPPFQFYSHAYHRGKAVQVDIRLTLG